MVSPTQPPILEGHWQFFTKQHSHNSHPLTSCPQHRMIGLCLLFIAVPSLITDTGKGNRWPWSSMNCATLSPQAHPVPVSTSSGLQTLPSPSTQGPSFLLPQDFTWSLSPHSCFPNHSCPSFSQKKTSFLIPLPGLDLLGKSSSSFSFIVLNMVAKYIFIHIVSHQGLSPTLSREWGPHLMFPFGIVGEGCHCIPNVLSFNFIYRYSCLSVCIEI